MYNQLATIFRRCGYNFIRSFIIYGSSYSSSGLFSDILLLSCYSPFFWDNLSLLLLSNLYEELSLSASL
jgi:hypothetical protein